MNDNTIRPVELKRIARGVALLDSVDPKWYRKINPATFSLDDVEMCVLGHVYGEYLGGLQKLAGDVILAPLRTLKFDIAPQVDVRVTGRVAGRHYGFETTGNASYERMGQTWLAIVRQRERAAKRARQRAAARRNG